MGKEGYYNLFVSHHYFQLSRITISFCSASIFLGFVVRAIKPPTFNMSLLSSNSRVITSSWVIMCKVERLGVFAAWGYAYPESEESRAFVVVFVTGDTYIFFIGLFKIVSVGIPLLGGHPAFPFVAFVCIGRHSCRPCRRCDRDRIQPGSPSRIAAQRV